MQKKFILSIVIILVVTLVIALNWTPYGHIDLKNTYCILNPACIVGNINMSGYNITGYCYNGYCVNVSWINPTGNPLNIGGNINMTGNITGNLASLTNTHLHHANNITNEYWVNQTGDTMTGNLNMSANITLGDNKYICLGDSGCADSYIYFNGSSLIIKVN